MKDGYHNGKGSEQAAFRRMRTNPLFEPYISAYTELMGGSLVDSAKIHLRLKVNRQEHMGGFDRETLNWESYRADGETAMENIVATFILIERGTFP